MRQSQCELVRERCGDPANAVGKLAKIARGKLAILQKVEQKGIYVRTHRLHGIQCERIAVPLIGMENAQRRVQPLREQCEPCLGL